MNRKGLAVFLLIIAVSALIFSGCTRKLLWSGNSDRDHIEATYKRFTGAEKKAITLEEGDTLVIDYQSEVSEGTLSLTLTDPDGDEIVSLAAGTAGTERVESAESGKYTLWIKGDKTGGSLRIYWSVE